MGEEGEKGEKGETEYQLAQPVGDSSEKIKQGHNCCGGCCDVRRATIVVNLVNLGLVGLQVMTLISVKNAAGYLNNVDDDEVQAALGEYPENVRLGGVFAFIGLNVCRSIIYSNRQRPKIFQSCDGGTDSLNTTFLLLLIRFFFFPIYLQVLCTCLAITGAIQYRAWMVCVGAAWYCVAPWI